MKTRHHAAFKLLAIILLASASFVLVAQDKSAQDKSDPTTKDAPLSREEILKQGPDALQKNCVGCHLADKWEGTNRDRDGWAAIVAEMAKLMDDAKMAKMNDKTFNLIVDYLTLTRPQ